MIACRVINKVGTTNYLSTRESWRRMSGYQSESWCSSSNGLCSKTTNQIIWSRINFLKPPGTCNLDLFTLVVQMLHKARLWAQLTGAHHQGDVNWLCKYCMESERTALSFQEETPWRKWKGRNSTVEVWMFSFFLPQLDSCLTSYDISVPLRVCCGNVPILPQFVAAAL